MLIWRADPILAFSGGYCYFNKIDITLPLVHTQIPIKLENVIHFGLEKIIAFPLYVTEFVCVLAAAVLLYTSFGVRSMPENQQRGRGGRRIQRELEYQNKRIQLQSSFRITQLIIQNITSLFLALYFLHFICVANYTNSYFKLIEKDLKHVELLGGVSILAGVLMGLTPILKIIIFFKDISGSRRNFSLKMSSKDMKGWVTRMSRRGKNDNKRRIQDQRNYDSEDSRRSRSRERERERAGRRNKSPGPPAYNDRDRLEKRRGGRHVESDKTSVLAYKPNREKEPLRDRPRGQQRSDYEESTTRGRDRSAPTRGRSEQYELTELDRSPAPQDANHDFGMSYL